MGKDLLIVTLLVVAIVYYFGVFKIEPRQGKIVEIKTGKIQGIVSKSRDGRDFYEWLGIPYAKPPVGPLRFASPVPAERWIGIKDTTKYGPKCAQLEMLKNRIIGQEDCLYINVHAPKVGNSDELPKGLPVMVFIHGGAFIYGSADSYRPEYFMDQDVILVTMNYRLGSFGFLSTGDGVVRGNMGLKDQALALKWVQENIHTFGGDPAIVTLFGESAGAVSVHYHLLSTISRGLFLKAIVQSGTAIAPVAVDSPEGSKLLATRLAASMGCDYDDTVKVVECLRRRSVEQILDGSTAENHKFHEAMKPDMHVHRFRPTIETVDDGEAFMTEHPLTALAKGQAQRVPVLMGITADEGLLTSIEFYRNESAMTAFEYNWKNEIGRTFGIRATDSRLTEIAAKIRQYYFPQGLSKPTREEKLRIYTKMFSDSLFNVYVSEAAKMQRVFSPTYLYHFSIHGGPSLHVSGTEPKDYGVCHGDDLPMLFQKPEVATIQKNGGESDRLYYLSKDMVKLWTDFASGDRTNLQFRGVKLEPVKQTGPLEYLDIWDAPEMIPEPFEERIEFLKSLNYSRTTC